MDCYLYRSPRRVGTYLFLAREDDFDCLPNGLRESFGEPEFLRHITLTEDRRLAREDPQQVRHNLSQQGYHLQLPPDVKPERVDQ